jgi:hypothetical protein
VFESVRNPCSGNEERSAREARGDERDGGSGEGCGGGGGCGREQVSESRSAGMIQVHTHVCTSSRSYGPCMSPRSLFCFVGFSGGRRGVDRREVGARLVLAGFLEDSEPWNLLKVSFTVYNTACHKRTMPHKRRYRKYKKFYKKSRRGKRKRTLTRRLQRILNRRVHVANPIDHWACLWVSSFSASFVHALLACIL